jgi:hypothetical protein
MRRGVLLRRHDDAKSKSRAAHTGNNRSILQSRYQTRLILAEQSLQRFAGPAIRGGGAAIDGCAGIREDDRRLPWFTAERRIHITLPAPMPVAAEGCVNTPICDVSLPLQGCCCAAAFRPCNSVAGASRDAVYASEGMVIKRISAGLAGRLPLHLFLFRSLLLTVAEATSAGDKGLSDCVLAAESLQLSPSLTLLKSCGELSSP